MTENMTCFKCNGTIRVGPNLNNKVECKECASFFHRACVSFASNGTWACRRCEAAAAGGSSDGSHDAEPSTREILDAIRAQGKSHNALIKAMSTELQTSIASCDAKIDSVRETLSDVTARADRLELENSVLKDRVLDLERRVADAEQYSRVNDIDVHGIPCLPGENVHAVLASLGRALGHPITPEMIDVTHRTGPPRSAQRAILVRFLRKADKEEILKARRVKRDLTVGRLDAFTGLTGTAATAVVYVNESLSPARREMMKKAREYKRDNKFSDVWVQGGKLYVRKSQGGERYLISDNNHLAALAGLTLE